MILSNSSRFVVGSVGVALVATLVNGHGTFVKPCFNVTEDISQPAGSTWVNSKANAATRGAATVEETTIFMMDPPLNHTGTLDAVGWRATIQDEDAATFEPVEMHWVKYANNGTDPETGPGGVFHQYSWWTFFPGLTGRQSAEFNFTSGPPLKLREKTHGISIKLPAAPLWPADGLALHGQLNLTNDPLQPRVPAPYDQQVWAFEKTASQTSAVPLGGRTLDTLEFATLWAVDPVLQTFVVSNAYGNGPEELYGPESMHPDASRGDQVGILLQGGNDGAAGTAFVFLSQTLTNNPFALPGAAGTSPLIWLDPVTLFPLPIMAGAPNPQHGQLKFPSFPISLFPVGFRDFWLQCLVYYPPVAVPPSGLIRLTDAVGIKGI